MKEQPVLSLLGQQVADQSESQESHISFSHPKSACIIDSNILDLPFNIHIY